MQDQAKRQIGDYKVLERLGAGAMGEVYKVRHTISDHVEAMKIMIAGLAGDKQLLDEFSIQYRRLCRLLFGIVVASAVSAGWIASSEAQITLPGGVRIQIPNIQAPNSRDRTGRAGTVRPSADQVCPNLVAWAKPVFDEYPQQDLMHIELGRLSIMEIPLFADPNFVPFFKKSYPQMSTQELDTIFRQQFMVCDQSSYRTQLPGLEYAFQVRGGSSPLSYIRLPAALSALQSARDALAQQLQTWQGMPPSSQNYDALAASRANVSAFLPLVWPSERAAFQQAFTATQAKMAPTVLNEKIIALLEAPSSVEAVRALRNAPTRYRELFSQVPLDQAQQLRSRMDARILRNGEAILGEQRTLMTALVGTREGLKRGAEWLQQFESVEVNELHLLGAEELAATYKRKRVGQLAAYAPELRRSIEAAKTEAGLQLLLDEAYPLTSDRSTPEYARMQQASAQRAAVFEKQQQAEDLARQRAEASRESKLAAAAPAQRTSTRRTGQSAAATEPINHASFTAHGLESEPVFNALYSGDFDKVAFGRDDPLFGSLAGGYMSSYWDQCQRYLSIENRVDIMTQECKSYSHLVNGYGVQVSADTCQRWEDVPTGKFADRKLYNAVRSVEGQQTKSMLSGMLKNMANMQSLSDMFTGPINMAAALVKISQESGSLIELNGCTSPELKRFQENVQLFALGKLGVKPDGSKMVYAATKGAGLGESFKDSNWDRMLEDMISAQAQTWLANRYVAGSVSDGTVTKRDTMGRPLEIFARYAYLQMGSSKQSGSLTLRFSDGLPECLYFSDLPNNCVTPSRKLIAAYGNGNYR